MIPRTTARRLLRDLSSSPRAALRPFTTTPRSLLSPQRPPPANLPPSPLDLQQAAASAALKNLSHLTPAQITTLLSAAPPPPAAAPSRRSILLRRALWALFFFALGYKLTSDQMDSIRFLMPLLYPPQDFHPDDFSLIREEATADAVADVPALGAMASYVDVSSDGKQHLRMSNWDSWEPYEDFSAERRAKHLCAGTLNNPNALGLVHQVFRHRLTGELVLAVVFGQGTSGWPGVVHGGMTSTVMDEAMGRLAALRFSANTAVTATLRLDFKEPVTPGLPYIVRVHEMVPEVQLARSGGEDKTDRKLWVFGRMEAPDGAVAMEASGLFVVPKGVEVQPLGKRF
ncbi:thioesterase [Colletotrichum musicola]|uniref:Thioesterase n=1 Tax=Colletotrichum musicola TaxID=2175873 RepID=A0A8H6U4J7_9PEZI|nr:thioesterase [Colletotrichum musicola]